MNRIVRKNLRRMIINGIGNMPYLLARESVGGNAGSWKDYPCAAAFFYYDPSTGEIKYFGNSNEVSFEIDSIYPQHFFRVAFNWSHGNGQMIINYLHPQEATTTTRQILEETVNVYNKKYGFKP